METTNANIGKLMNVLNKGAWIVGWILLLLAFLTAIPSLILFVLANAVSGSNV